jgi:glutamate-ammonia-ligase adenylyltransferase
MWRRLLAVLGASTVLGDHLVANPDDWRLLGEPLSGGGLPPADSVPALRLGYRRTLLRIVAADLTGANQLEATMAALSDLADATLRAALGFATVERPAEAAACRLAVIAMGKCGGRELNYVSDVDVVFVAEPPTDGDTADVDAVQRAASTLAARTMTICATVAWPVDAALRPEGGRGPLTRTVASYVAYYRKWAKTWEFQALLKSRVAAGDGALGRSGSPPSSRSSGRRPSGPRPSRTSGPCAGASSRRCRSPKWTARSSAARAACATSSSPCSFCNWSTGGPTRSCARRPLWTRCAS